MDKIIDSKNNKGNISLYNIDKIKYLQKVIKLFLKRKKIHKSNNSSNKSLKQAGLKSKHDQDKNPEKNLIIHYHYNSHSKKTSSKSQNFKNINSVNNNTVLTKNDSSPKNGSPKNRSPKNKSPKNRAKITSFPNKFKIQSNNKDYNNLNLESELEICKHDNNDDEVEDDNGIFIPTLKPEILENDIFKKDPFKSNTRNIKIKNDPRDAPINNIRKKYPLIKEGNSSYLGEWKNRKRDGLGLLCLENDSKFIGHFSENKVHGYGRLWRENGDLYKGQWKDFQAEGWGIYCTQKGSFFRGMWTKNRQNGFGVERWPRGSVFFGEYNMGNKNGYGVLNFESKAWYEGEFKNGIIYGIGSFFFEDGRRYQGTWNNNKMDGYGYIIWPDKNFYEGEFKEDKKEGFGICKIGKKIFMGIWFNNKLEGKVIVIENGNIKKQFWKNGKAFKNLPSDSYIIFENYAKKYVNDLKNHKSIE